MLAATQDDAQNCIGKKDLPEPRDAGFKALEHIGGSGADYGYRGSHALIGFIAMEGGHGTPPSIEHCERDGCGPSVAEAHLICKYRPIQTSLKLTFHKQRHYHMSGQNISHFIMCFKTDNCETHLIDWPAQARLYSRTEMSTSEIFIYLFIYLRFVFAHEIQCRFVSLFRRLLFNVDQTDSLLTS